MNEDLNLKFFLSLSMRGLTTLVFLVSYGQAQRAQESECLPASMRKEKENVFRSSIFL